MKRALLVASIAVLAACTAEQTDPVAEVIDRIDLPLPDMRDNTDGMCNDTPCRKWITTDRATFIQWNTAEDATHWAELNDTATVIDQVVTIHFNDKGEVDRDAYIEQATG